MVTSFVEKKRHSLDFSITLPVLWHKCLNYLKIFSLFDQMGDGAKLHQRCNKTNPISIQNVHVTEDA